MARLSRWVVPTPCAPPGSVRAMLRGAAAAARRCGRGLAAGPDAGRGQAGARRCSGAARRRQWLPPAGRDSGIVAYNSRSRSKEPLVLATEGVATW